MARWSDRPIVKLAISLCPYVFSVPVPFMALRVISACSLSTDINFNEMVKIAKELDEDDYRAISEDLNG